MHRLSLLLLFAASLAAALPAAAQTTPRRPPADTLRFGATRPAAGDSIAMARYDEDDADSADVARADAPDEAEEDTVPRKPRLGPYARAAGTGPFSVQASGETAARPPRGEVVWLGGRAARPAADSARRDTARAGTGQRVASGQSARRDTASAATNRPTRRDSASTATNRPTRRDSASTATNRPTRRDSASTAANRPARRDTTATASRPAARDTAGARRNGQAAASTTGRPGSTPPTTSTTGGRTGSTSTPTGTTGRTGANSGSAARARTHTVASGETFYAIARRYGVTAAQLRAINPDVEMDSLEIGDVLRLPASARDSRAGASGAQAPRTGTQTPARTGNQSGSQAQRRSHTVAAGETLFGIARRYGVTVAAIREANGLETDQVRTGQRLVIPPAR